MNKVTLQDLLVIFIVSGYNFCIACATATVWHFSFYIEQITLNSPLFKPLSLEACCRCHYPNYQQAEFIIYL